MATWIESLGNSKALISFIVLIIVPSFITLISSTKAERTQYSKELRLVYQTIIYGASLVVYPLLVGFSASPNDKLILYFKNNQLLVDLIIFIGCIFLFYVYIRINYLKKKLEKKKRIKSSDYDSEDLPKRTKTKKNLGIIECFIYYIISLYYLFHIMFIYGYIVTSFSDSIQILAFTISYLLITALPINLILELFKDKLVCNITLKNGKVLKNVYILHPTLGKKILISNKEKVIPPYHQILISKDDIDRTDYLVTNQFSDVPIEIIEEIDPK
ncbi:hypothetical protein [Niallia sp. 03133]|uniref:hypothetical protein n=1 Tax=Niallia sp. 03133 TaxID=3458060 RepID=UPI004043F012